MATKGSNILKVHSHFATDKGFAIALPSCRFTLFMLRNYQAFRSAFEQQIAAFIFLKSLCHLHARYTHHDSIDIESIYLNSIGSILVGCCASLFKDVVVLLLHGWNHRRSITEVLTTSCPTYDSSVS
ncbi:hypothetical protein ACB092_06G252300 [Castanea dentata]